MEFCASIQVQCWLTVLCSETRHYAKPQNVVRTLPNFPNFRLYDLQGSICDTLGIDGSTYAGQAPAPVPDMQISPNPFDAVLRGGASESGLFGYTMPRGVWRMKRLSPPKSTFCLLTDGLPASIFGSSLWRGNRW